MLLADQSLCLVYLQLFIPIKLKLKLTFCFVVKCLISIFKFGDSSNLLFFYELSLCPEQSGEFHISHDASLHTILSSFRTHVILSVQQGRDS